MHPGTPTPSAVFLIGAVCAAQVLAQLGAFTFFALLPTFFLEWNLSHTEAGVLNGIIFGAYAISVPFIVPMTDRIDPRRVYISAVALTTCSHLGMAFLAHGFVDGLMFRVLAGIGWGGTYMVGLKALADLVEGPAQSRAVAFHAASIGVGGALSFVIAGWIVEVINWQAAFQLSAVGSFLALLVMAIIVPGRQQVSDHGYRGIAPLLLAFKNNSAIAYSIGYFAHTWEMFTLRSWVVTFLVFTAAQGEGPPDFLIPTVVAMFMELTGTVASVVGNEIAIRLGRRRWILSVMLVSLASAAVVGYSAGAGYGTAAVVCVLYNMMIYGDSASLTAGAVGTAEPELRGATLAVHGMLGYSGGFIGPLVLGVLLDILGGETVMNWGVSFAHVSIVVLIGVLVIKLLKPVELPGDRV